MLNYQRVIFACQHRQLSLVEPSRLWKWLPSIIIFVFIFPALHCRHHPVVKSIPAFCLSTSPFMVCKKTGSNVRNPMILRAQFPNLQAIPSLKSPKHSPKFFPIILKIPPTISQQFHHILLKHSRRISPKSPATNVPVKSQALCGPTAQRYLCRHRGTWRVKRAVPGGVPGVLEPFLGGGDWSMNFMTFHIGNVIIPTGELILFFHILGMSSSQLANSYFSEG